MTIANALRAKAWPPLVRTCAIPAALRSRRRSWSLRGAGTGNLVDAVVKRRDVVHVELDGGEINSLAVQERDDAVVDLLNPVVLGTACRLRGVSHNVAPESTQQSGAILGGDGRWGCALALA